MSNLVYSFGTPDGKIQQAIPYEPAPRMNRAQRRAGARKARRSKKGGRKP